MPRSALYELLSQRLDQDVCEWCRKRRMKEPGVGYRRMAEELEERTGRHVSHMSLSTWCRDLQEQDESGDLPH